MRSGDRAPSIARRKSEHMRIALAEGVDGPLSAGFEDLRFVHQALPEVDLHAVDLTTRLLGKELRAPILISCMTGGTEETGRINRLLAAAAQEAGIALGLGSLRAAMEHPALARTFQVRDAAPGILLLANLGAVQLNYGFTVDDCRRAMELTGADALVLHLNPLQEALQESGDTDFHGLRRKIKAISAAMPVVLKEVGWGISQEIAAWAADAGIAALDVAGAGGTSFGMVEAARAPGPLRQAAETFAGWGLTTVESLLAARRGAPGLPLIASGGIRTGLDIAKAVALGATLGGVARPFLEAAAESPQAVSGLTSRLTLELRIACFCAGAANLAELSRVPLLSRERCWTPLNR